MTWNILYRGSLSSCNYACPYCPFAKTSNTRAELASDADALARFVDWVGHQRDRRIGVLFTPWGEGLIHPHYRRAMLELGAMPHLYRVAIQTNLSCSTEWLDDADRDTVALWTTFHPGETTLGGFVAKSLALRRLGIRHSVGVVGKREHFAPIEQLRGALDPSTYLWVNAYKDEPDYYRPGEVERLTAVDPHFEINRRDYDSLGKPCRAGHTSFTVDSEGAARRCHFLPVPIGNIYQDGFRDALRPRACDRAVCDCHIGYVHRPELGLYELFGDGVLERIVEVPSASRPS